jgi:Flp pilus assembly protein TadG
MTRLQGRKHGSTFLEFVLVGIPMIFVLISIFEMARGMWIYHTLAYAVKEGTRYAVVHGKGCSNGINTCSITVAQIASRIKTSGIGLLPENLSITMSGVNSTVTCSTANTCPNAAAVWPPSGSNAPGQPITITVVYPFRSAISMFWPGAGAGRTFGVFNLPASSREIIQF